MDDDIDQTEMSITELNESHRSAGSGGHSSSKGSNGGSIPSSPFNAPPKVSGWVEHKYTNISEHRLCEDWTLQWLALEVRCFLKSVYGGTVLIVSYSYIDCALCYCRVALCFGI
jgi:hypothetical protein